MNSFMWKIVPEITEIITSIMKIITTVSVNKSENLMIYAIVYFISFNFILL